MILGNFEDCIPSKFYLCQNAPNPFKEITKIKYCIPFKVHVNLTLLDSGGNFIKKLVNKIMDAGTYEINFISNNLRVGSYIYQLEAFDIEVSTKLIYMESKMMLILDK